MGPRWRPRDPAQLHRRGLHLLRVVHLRDGRSLPHLRWLRPYGGVAGARATPHSRLPQLEASAPNGNRSRCRGMKKPGAVPPQPGLDVNQVVLKLDLARPVVTQFWLNYSNEYRADWRIDSGGRRTPHIYPKV